MIFSFEASIKSTRDKVEPNILCNFTKELQLSFNRFFIMNYWLINPKKNGPQTEISENAVYMGWPKKDCPKFYNEVKKGDAIVVCANAHKNNECHYIGVADYLDENEQCWYLKYTTDKYNAEISNCIKSNPSDFHGGNSSNPWGSTKSIIELPSVNAKPSVQTIERLLNKMVNDSKVEELKDLLLANHNLILTGAPGTGKTYLAKEIAQLMIFGKIIEDKNMSDEDRRKFNEQIGFVQFHPSYDYTDFVEGLRPIQDEESDSVGFEPTDGIFKEFCINALESSSNSIASATASSTSSNYTTGFETCWKKMIEDIRTQLANNKLTQIGNWNYQLSKKDTLKFQSINTKSNYSFTITEQNVKDTYMGGQARPSNTFRKEMEEIVQYMKDYYGLKDYKANKLDGNKSQSNNDKSNKYVFIIDEINRGEISKIFGELFFSIDPGYRGVSGKVRTQYANMQKNSRNKFDEELGETSLFGHFFVPKNVYIIGTMNDIDRSVESMDFAFRRRFAFKEVTAEDSQTMFNNDDIWVNEEGNLVKPDIQKLKNRMDNLNKAIESKEIGLSSAYHIGASYFLKLKNYNNNYEQLWNYHIQGLLHEYLRGNPDIERLMEKLKNAYNNENVSSENNG